MSINTLKEKEQAIEILLVEDNYGDALLLRKAFDKLETKTNISVAEDGEKGLLMLAQKGEFSEQPTPDLILLDINLPRLNGKEVLAKIKQHDVHKYIPVIMLTSSSAEMDVLKSYDSGANAYVVKPVDLSQLAEIAKAIELFWFHFNITLDVGKI